MQEVKFREYRQYVQQRVDANDAIMALLVGSQIASNALRLNEGSKLRLGDIFPGINYIKRLDVNSSEAQRILGLAEQNLGYMALPYILSVHEDLQRTFLKLLSEAGLLSRRKATETSAAKMHEQLQDSSGLKVNADSLAIYHVIRQMRNRIIHDAGASDAQVELALNSLSTAQMEIWRKLSGGSLPDLTPGLKMRIGHNEIVVALAIVKQLARDMNEAAQSFYARDLWTRRLIDDATQEGLLRGNPLQKLKRVTGFGRTNYSPLNITADEVGKIMAKK